VTERVENSSRPGWTAWLGAAGQATLSGVRHRALLVTRSVRPRHATAGRDRRQTDGRTMPAGGASSRHPPSRLHVSQDRRWSERHAGFLNIAQHAAYIRATCARCTSAARNAAAAAAAAAAADFCSVGAATHDHWPATARHRRYHMITRRPPAAQPQQLKRYRTRTHPRRVGVSTTAATALA